MEKKQDLKSSVF